VDAEAEIWFAVFGGGGPMNVTHASDTGSHVRFETSWPNFSRHFIEMVVAMLVGMAVLGATVSLIFGLLGHSNLLHYAGLRGLLMTGYMTIGMALWMRHRRHGWRTVAEMGAAMLVPYLVLIGPFLAGRLSAGSFLGAMHALMLPSMVVAMLARRDQYSQDHRMHTPHRTVTVPRSFARFNRRVANPFVRLIAGRLSPFAIVNHTGRISGRAYRTPVVGFAKSEFLMIALIYGARSDWVRNVVAAGAATVTRGGRSDEYGEPQIVGHDEARGRVRGILRVPVRLFGADLLQMTRSARSGSHALVDGT
jgi:deazaflavin-dependent oxidoreductase (nitroreductase family)